MSEPVLWVLVVIAVAATSVLIYYASKRFPREARERLRDSVRAFGHAAERRAGARLGRADEVATLALRLGNTVGLRRTELRQLELACHLRHIGLTAIPYRILHKESADWTPAEEATFSRHAEVGASMLELIPSLRAVAPIVQCHVAWWDGSHTPYLPAQFDIPMVARVLAVADAFVSQMTRAGVDAARAQLEQGRGTRFDPAIVDAMETIDLDGLTVERYDERGTRVATG